jgi:CRP-like cAMP-binding protein
VSRIQQVIDTLEAERADLQERLTWLEQQIKEFHAHGGNSAPASRAPRARSARRGTAPRATGQRPTTRTRQVDIKARIVEFLSKHPGSTAGDVAKGLDLNRGSVSTRLSQLAKSGEIKKAARGYAAKDGSSDRSASKPRG